MATLHLYIKKPKADWIMSSKSRLKKQPPILEIFIAIFFRLTPVRWNVFLIFPLQIKVNFWCFILLVFIDWLHVNCVSVNWFTGGLCFDLVALFLHPYASFRSLKIFCFSWMTRSVNSPRAALKNAVTRLFSSRCKLWYKSMALITWKVTFLYIPSHILQIK